MSVRLLSDPHGLFYDIFDMFESALDGEQWTDRWPCGANRKIAVGDTAFIVVAGEQGSPAIFARAQVIAADERDQVRLLDPDSADLSEAYCRNVLGADPQILFVRIVVDSVVNPFAADAEGEDLEELLALAELDQPACVGTDLPAMALSGEALPEACAALVQERWEGQIIAREPHGKATRLPTKEE
ncbi:hypothetical protein F8S13_07420 [Chloroflexia bacterium SDU3-3]|nr:hypothetical protein F8S13_07420 [Chloroflexia bacterium SDU3-3]